VILPCCLSDQQNERADSSNDGPFAIGSLTIRVTAPLLERSFPIIKAWGFEYKTNFVWDKIDHVMGFYNSVRHEIY
jgi:hypothetical protein